MLRQFGGDATEAAMLSHVMHSRTGEGKCLMLVVCAVIIGLGGFSFVKRVLLGVRKQTGLESLRGQLFRFRRHWPHSLRQNHNVR